MPHHPPRPAEDLLADEPRTAAARRLLPAPTSVTALDRLVELAARLLGVSNAQVSVLTDVQAVAAACGPQTGPVGSDIPLSEAFCGVTGCSRGPLVVHDAATDTRVAHLEAARTGRVGAYLGVPLRDEDGHVVGTLCVYEPRPRRWADHEVALLQQVAATAVAQLELAALSEEHERTRLRWSLATEAAGMGSFDWDLRSGVLLWDDALIELFGYERGGFDETIGSFSARLHPEDRQRTEEAIAEATAGCGMVDLLYRVLVPGRPVKWVQARGRVLCDEDGLAVRMLGAAYDTTATKDADARVARVLESMSAAFYSLDRHWRFSYVNAEAERLLQRSRDELLGGSVWELFPATVGSSFETTYRRAVETGQTETFEAHYPAPLDGWYEIRVFPSPDGLAVYFTDVTERHHAQERAEAAVSRLALLAEVTNDLTQTLDATTAVARLARIVVPALGDGSVVTLVDDVGAVRDVGSWHADERLRPAMERWLGSPSGGPGRSALAVRALALGRVVAVAEGARALLATEVGHGDQWALLERLAPRSAAAVPLRARGRTVGLLTVFRSGGAVTGEEIATAEEVAARAGLALDNARLYDQQRRMAEELQRSLLTDPVEPDHLDVVVRYLPAAEAAQVGGDWHDAFLQPGGALNLVIGDVVGHDTAAAGAMGQVRGLLRGIAFHSGAGPAQVLAGLDQAMAGLGVRTTATAALARLEQTPEEEAEGVTRVRWSNAGHPPPMVLHPDGSTDVLAEAEPDLLLGIDPATPRQESVFVLRRCDTLVLFTDGLVERRDQSLDEGLERLRALLTELAELPLADLCDAVVARLLPQRREDDAAIVAVRLHPQDRPRPAEAGPNRLPDDLEGVGHDEER